jgi:ubiquinone/menaquinone biosynthesis C-methylase UbiE
MADADKGPPPQAQLAQMLNGFWLSYSIVAAAQLGVADEIGDAPASVARLAERASADVEALYRLLRALASAGIFREEDGRAFSHTPLSRTLRRDLPGSMHGLATMIGLMSSRAWPELAHSVRTGEPAFNKVFGVHNVFEHLERDLAAARAFDAAMAGYTAVAAREVVAHYDFSPFGTVVDVGGGTGALLAAILTKFPQPRGINFDLPHVAERAREQLTKSGVGARCEVVAGSFFESVPAADCYTIKRVIHDWDDDTSVAILRTLRKSIASGGKLLVLESVVPPGNAPSFAKFLDVNMLVMTGGRERTEAEYRALFGASGFQLERVVPCGSIDILEARPA